MDQNYLRQQVGMLQDRRLESINDAPELRGRIREILQGKIAMGAAEGYGEDMGDGRIERKYWMQKEDDFIPYSRHLRKSRKKVVKKKPAKKRVLKKKKGGLYPVTENYPSSREYVGSACPMCEGGVRKRKAVKRRSAGSKTSKRRVKSNPWLKFLKAYRKNNAKKLKGLTQAEVVKKAAKEYKRSN